MLTLTSIPTAEHLIAALPPDDETSERCQTFRLWVRESRNSAHVTAMLMEVYRLAADGRWGQTLHDLQMLLSALELNCTLVVKVAPSVNTLLQRYPRIRRSQYWVWLYRKCSLLSVQPEMNSNSEAAGAKSGESV